MRKIAIFDMDGTLIDSGLDITVSINHVRKVHYGLMPLEVHEVVDAINAPVRNLSSIFYGTEFYENEARELFERHYYDQCIQNVCAYNGIEDLLNSLKLNGVAMGVATNAPSIFAKRMLRHLDLDHFFHLIIGADNVEIPKPHPQMLHTHLEYHQYRYGTDRAWMVGDNVKDMEAARSAGIPGIFAGWGFSREGMGDHIVFRPEELVEIICTKGDS